LKKRKKKNSKNLLKTKLKITILFLISIGKIMIENMKGIVKMLKMNLISGIGKLMTMILLR